MNREIKFRIWNGLEMESKVLVGELGNFYVQGLDEKDTASISPFNTKYHESVKVMQFTGALDKNGKEIFEGDILANEKRKGFVSWNMQNLRYWIEGEMENGKSDWFYIGWKYEVIGNIYQNPELLK